MIWYPVNAQLDGLDPLSESPQDRLRYMVYQRRLLVEALKAKAMLVAMVNPKEAPKAAEDYFSIALPVSDSETLRRDLARETMMREVAKMAPIPLSTMRFGGSSMAPPT